MLEFLKRIFLGVLQPMPKPISSWMGVFQADLPVVQPNDIDELVHTVRNGAFSVVGAEHSYNGVQVVRDTTAIRMKGSGLNRITYNDETHEVTVEPAVTILELKQFLVKRDRRLISSGNFMEQTVIGALATGTHGYGAQAVMTEYVTALKFIDEAGKVVEMTKADPDFVYVVLSFGMIAPIISMTLITAPTQSFEATTLACRLSQKSSYVQPGDGVMYAVLPYSDRDDPTIALQTIRPAPTSLAGTKAQATVSSIFTLRGIAEFIIHRYWVFDRMFPALRRPFQQFVTDLDLHYKKVYYTDPDDLDYLYDPAAGLESSRAPDILREMFSAKYTAYNLAFFVRLEDSHEVIKFIMWQADQFRRLGFYIKTMISVRELSTTSDLPFAGNFDRAVAAIDLFADVRDYAWLERIQREVFAGYDDVRPHWGKSAIVEEFKDTIGHEHLRKLRALHDTFYPSGRLLTTNRIARLFDLPIRKPK